MAPKGKVKLKKKHPERREDLPPVHIRPDGVIEPERGIPDEKVWNSMTLEEKVDFLARVVGVL